MTEHLPVMKDGEVLAYAQRETGSLVWHWDEYGDRFERIVIAASRSDAKELILKEAARWPVRTQSIK